MISISDPKQEQYEAEYWHKKFKDYVGPRLSHRPDRIEFPDSRGNTDFIQKRSGLFELRVDR